MAESALVLLWYFCLLALVTSPWAGVPCLVGGCDGGSSGEGEQCLPTRQEWNLDVFSTLLGDCLKDALGSRALPEAFLVLLLLRLGRKGL